MQKLLKTYFQRNVSSEVLFFYVSDDIRLFKYVENLCEHKTHEKHELSGCKARSWRLTSQVNRL